METAIDTLLIEFGGVVLGLAITARLAHRFGLPVLPIYLLAGLAFGEGGVLELGAATGFIEVGAEIGVILMLLMLGLEFSAHELITNVRRSTLGGLVDLVLNFTPGFVAGLLLDFDMVVAVLLGGVTYISSSGIVAKLVADLDRVRNRETPVILSLLIVEDLAMVIYLPIVTGVLFGNSAAETIIIVAISFIAVVGILSFAYYHGDRLSEMVLSHSSEVLLLTLLGSTLIIAGLAERVHVSAAVGAFLVGIALSGKLVEQARELLEPLRDLFAASFFVFFGLQVDPSLIPNFVLVAIAMGAITTVTKLGTGWVAARSEGLGTQARILAGMALVAHGEFSIVIAEIGVAREPDLGAVAATYVIFTAVVGGLLYHFGDTLSTRLTLRKTKRQ
ncbi:cation:proton antiporter [Candidatus Poriferisocius sp.]|uniref:cation:proton antiporter n=1 Tax=Candidatus Poriferisocius sp. TaxID=3101276 RepID=UPI003B02A96D